MTLFSENHVFSVPPSSSINQTDGQLRVCALATLLRHSSLGRGKASNVSADTSRRNGYWKTEREGEM